MDLNCFRFFYWYLEHKVSDIAEDMRYTKLNTLSTLWEAAYCKREKLKFFRICRQKF